jgi:metal-dependent hydrolase (beta-lactamase superfamily II)
VYLNNLGLLKIDVAGVDALVLSHGHFDHLGGLIGFLEAQRPQAGDAGEAGAVHHWEPLYFTT